LAADKGYYYLWKSNHDRNEVIKMVQTFLTNPILKVVEFDIAVFNVVDLYIELKGFRTETE